MRWRIVKIRKVTTYIAMRAKQWFSDMKVFFY